MKDAYDYNLPKEWNYFNTFDFSKHPELEDLLQANIDEVEKY